MLVWRLVHRWARYLILPGNANASPPLVPVKQQLLVSKNEAQQKCQISPYPHQATHIQLLFEPIIDFVQEPTRIALLTQALRWEH